MATRYETAERLKSLGFTSTLEFLLSKINELIATPVDECVEWDFARTKEGYGLAFDKGRAIRAHRLALEVKLGYPLGALKEACHTCDNPKCFNPGHLFSGTKAQNMIDMTRKGRMGRLEPLTQARRNAVLDAYQLGFTKSLISEWLRIDRATVARLTSDINIDIYAKLSKEDEEDANTGDVSRG